MKKLFLLTVLILTISLSFGQNKCYLYKGSVSNKLPITLFFLTNSNEHGQELYGGMYKYDKTGKWAKLLINKEESDSYVMVDISGDGYMLLNKNLSKLTGKWISAEPDKPQLSVSLSKIPLTNSEIKKYKERMLQLGYWDSFLNEIDSAAKK